MRGQNLLVAAILIAGMACAPEARIATHKAAPPVDLKAAAAAHYEAYGHALAQAQRSVIPGFYHNDGALVVFNGAARRESPAELRSYYESSWNPPAFFAWEPLAYDSLAPGKVIVTGGFRWVATGTPDTLRFIYAAVLVARDSGMAIVFEHETVRP